MYERLSKIFNQIDNADYHTLWINYCKDMTFDNGKFKPQSVFWDEDAVYQHRSQEYTKSARYCLKDFGRTTTGRFAKGWWKKSELESFRHACKQVEVWNHIGNWRNYDHGFKSSPRDVASCERRELKRMMAEGVIDDSFDIEPLRMREWRFNHQE